MKYLMTLTVGTLCFMLVGTVALRAFTHESQPMVVRDLRDVSPREITSMAEGDYPELALHVCAGERIPIRLKIGGDLLSFDKERMEIVPRRNFLVRMADDQILLSLDGQEWKTFEEWSQGRSMLSAQLAVDEEGLRVELGAQLCVAGCAERPQV